MLFSSMEDPPENAFYCCLHTNSRVCFWLAPRVGQPTPVQGESLTRKIHNIAVSLNHYDPREILHFW